MHLHWRRSQRRVSSVGLRELLALGQPPLPGAPLDLLTGIGQGAGIPGFDLLGQSWQEGIHNTLAAHSEALMGDIIWHLGDKTNLTTGVRFTQDTKKFSWYNPLRSAPGLDAQLAILSPDFFNQLVAAGEQVVESRRILRFDFDNGLGCVQLSCCESEVGTKPNHYQERDYKQTATFYENFPVVAPARLCLPG